MITIINTNFKNILPHCLVLSICVHVSVWALSPMTAENLELNERFIRLLQEQPQKLVTWTPVEPVSAPPAAPHNITPHNIKASESSSDQPSQIKRKTTISKPKKTRRARSKKRSTQRKKRETHKKRAHKKKRLSARPAQRKTAPQPKLVLTSTSVKSVINKERVKITKVKHTQPSKTQPSKTSTPSRSTQKMRLSKKKYRQLLRGYYSSLNHLMQSARAYPRGARRQGLEGVVMVEMVVEANGEISSVKLVRSSGHQILDKAALSQVQKMHHVPMIPKELKKRSLIFRIPFEYRLQS